MSQKEAPASAQSDLERLFALLDDASPFIRQGALKAIIAGMRTGTNLSKSDVRSVAKELAPQTNLTINNSQGSKSSDKKKKNKKPESAELVEAKKLLKATVADTTKYPTEQRGPESTYAARIREIRNGIKDLRARQGGAAGATGASATGK